MRAVDFANRPAVTMYPSGRTINYGEFDGLVKQFANMLRATGAPDEGGVALLLANQIEFPIAVLGARTAGFDHLPLNTHSCEEELLLLLKQFQPRVLVVSDAFAALAEKLALQLPQTVRLVMTGKPCAGWESFDQLLAQPYNKPVVVGKPGRLLLLSGGSTGVPKIVVRPNADRAHAARNGGALAFLPFDQDSALLLSAPLYHTMPVGWMVGGLDGGAHVVIMERWDCLRALEAIQLYKITLLPLVPTMMQRLLDLSQSVRDSYDVTSIAAVMHGAAPCPADVKRAFMAWIPPVWEAYGASEGLGMCRISPQEWLERPGSVGRPIQGGRITIRNKNGDELPPGQVGIVWFSRADGARMSYYGNADATAAVYNQHGEGSTYDLGYLDKDGYLFLAGREKNMLIVGGVNVYPERVEEALLSHEAVRDVGVIGVPCADLGQVPVAVVELNNGWNGSDQLSGELGDWYRQRANFIGRPRRVIFVDSVPRLPTGKLDSRALATLVQ